MVEMVALQVDILIENITHPKSKKPRIPVDGIPAEGEVFMNHGLPGRNSAR